MSKLATDFFIKLMISFSSTVLFSVIVLGIYGYYVIRPYSGEKIVEIEGDYTIEDDSIIGFVPKKNGKSWRHHMDNDLQYHLYTDKRGIRVNSPGIQTPDSVDLVTIGCSFSWGHGIESNKTYTSILSDNLKIKTANLAMGSYGTVQSLLFLQRNIDLKPKVIVYGFISDHIRRNLSTCAPNYAPICLSPAYIDFDEKKLPYIHSPIDAHSVEKNRLFYNDVNCKNFDFNQFIWGIKVGVRKLFRRSNQISIDSISSYRSTQFLIGELIKTAKSINAKLIIMYIPRMRPDLTTSAPHELTSSLSEDTYFLDLFPLIKEYYNSVHNSSLMLPDGHPNEIAHELIAKELQTFILSHKILN